MASRRQRDIAAQRIREREARRKAARIEHDSYVFAELSALDATPEDIAREYRRPRMGTRHDESRAAKGLAVKAPRKLTRVRGPYLTDAELRTDPTLRGRVTRGTPKALIIRDDDGNVIDVEMHAGRAATKRNSKGASVKATGLASNAPSTPTLTPLERELAETRAAHDKNPPKNDTVLFGTPKSWQR